MSFHVPRPVLGLGQKLLHRFPAARLRNQGETASFRGLGQPDINCSLTSPAPLPPPLPIGDHGASPNLDTELVVIHSGSGPVGPSERVLIYESLPSLPPMRSFPG